MTSTTRGRWALVTLVSLGLWGAVHVVGGLSLVATDTVAGLETLGSEAIDSVPAEPGEATEALVRFHGLNIALGGVAVLGLTIAWWRSRRSGPLFTALAVGVALDVGLLAFLVIPGTMPVTDGFFGPVLLVAAVLGATLMARPRVNDEAYASPA